MSIGKKLKNGLLYLTDPDYHFYRDAMMGKLNDMPDEEFLKRMFKYRMGYELNLDNPRTFNEKLQWLKLHDRKPIYTQMVDKYGAKQYVSERIGEKYTIPLLGLWDSFEQIDFDSLPNQFVLKCTHDSGGLVIVRDKQKLDKEAARRKIEKSLNRNFFYYGREWPYKNVKPRILAEQYMEDESGIELKDYKVLCFGGKARLIELHKGRYTDHQTQDFYDTNWNKTSISQSGLDHYQVTADCQAKPTTLNEMLALSERLSEGIPLLRVDWYSIEGRLYFGELTFFDGSGFDPFDDMKDDELLGSWISLPVDEKGR